MPRQGTVAGISRREKYNYVHSYDDEMDDTPEDDTSDDYNSDGGQSH